MQFPGTVYSDRAESQLRRSCDVDLSTRLPIDCASPGCRNRQVLSAAPVTRRIGTHFVALIFL